MKLNELNVLQLLKDKLIDAAEVRGLKLTDDAFGSKRWENSEKKVFYLYDSRNNLYETPRRKTKLGTGVNAVRSSAAMIFNLLGEKTITLNHKEYSGIEYEKKYPAIIDEKGDIHEAHLDAVFHSSDNSEMYAVEAKLLEWKDSPKNLAKAYLEPNQYYTKGKNSKDFIDFFETLISPNKETNKEGRYKHLLKKYDAIQMTIHTLALYNHFSQETSTSVKKLTLLNIVWKYDCDEYNKEEEEARQYMEAANKFFLPLFKQIGIDFSIEYSTFQDFKEKLVISDAKRVEYLKRYEVKA